MIPTSSALSSHLQMMELVYGGTLTLRTDLATLCRLQHEASTATPRPKVFSLDDERARRLAAECYDPDDHNPKGAA